MEDELFRVQKMGERLIIGIPKKHKEKFKVGDFVLVKKAEFVPASEMVKK